MDAQIARSELYLCAHKREAWTDVGSVGVVRRLDLQKSVAFSQISSHGGVAPLHLPSSKEQGRDEGASYS